MFAGKLDEGKVDGRFYIVVAYRMFGIDFICFIYNSNIMIPNVRYGERNDKMFRN